MEIIPVIELKAGKSARLTHIRYDQPNLLRNDPLAIAKRWKDEGATRLHIHDIDGARVGMPQNRDQVRDIIRRIGLPVQYSGGVRTVDVMERVLGWGVERVIADTEATIDLTIAPALEKMGGRAALEVKPFNTQIDHPGAPKGATLDVYEFVKQMNHTQPWRQYVFRIVYGDGTPAVPAAEIVKKLVEIARKPAAVYARVRTWDEFRLIRDAGAEGILIGESLYDGTMGLPDMIANAVAKPVQAAPDIAALIAGRTGQAPPPVPPIPQRPVAPPTQTQARPAAPAPPRAPIASNQPPPKAPGSKWPLFGPKK